MLHYPNARLLPLTIGVTATLIFLKSVSFGWEAFARQGTSTALPLTTSMSAAAATSSATSQVLPSPLRTAPRLYKSGFDDRSTPEFKTKADWDLLQELRTRRKELDARDSALDLKAEALRAASASLKQQLAELSTMRASLKGLEDARHGREDDAWMGLVKVYEAMRPADAATIFDTLDLHVLLEIVDRMNDRKAAAVLAAMTPERARLATQMLARLRVGRVVSPSDAAHQT